MKLLNNFLLNFFVILFLLNGCSSNIKNSKNTLDKNIYYSKPSLNKQQFSDLSDKDKAIKNLLLTPKENQALLDEAFDFCQKSQYFWQSGENENAVESLDKAYASLLKVDPNDNQEMLKQKEDIRLMISKRTLEINASKNKPVNGCSNSIPLAINKHVQFEIDQFTVGCEKEFFIEAYKRSGLYRNQIIEALKEAGLPEELSWMPLIESYFKIRALSKARALGLWQFIPSTGYRFGLKRDKFIDERMDPMKSTKAAIAYLKELHKMFGDWTTALAAYNCGEGKVLKVIRAQKFNYIDNFWDLYEILPRETARYVPRFIATINIINNLKKYGLDNITIEKPIEFETVTISKQVRLKDIANKIGTDEQTLVSLNGELRYNNLPSYAYQLKIPSGKVSILLLSIEDVATYSMLDFSKSRISPFGKKKIRLSKLFKNKKKINSKKIVDNNIVISQNKQKVNQKIDCYKVKSGDTLYSVAKRHNIKSKDLALLNKISNKKYITTGQILHIPSAESIKICSIKNYDKVEDIKNEKKFTYNKKNDNIAKLKNFNIKKLKRYNKIKNI